MKYWCISISSLCFPKKCVKDMKNHTKSIISYLLASIKRLVLHRECMLTSRCKVRRVDLKGGFSVKNQVQNHVIKKERF